MDQLKDLYYLTGFPFVDYRMVIMWAIVGVLFYLAVKKEFEPLLLIPIAFGALLANIPSESLLEEPAGEVVASAPGVVVATALRSDDYFKVPYVPVEIAEHLSRFRATPSDPGDPASVKKAQEKTAANIRAVFETESRRVKDEAGDLAAAVTRAQKDLATAEAFLASQIAAKVDAEKNKDAIRKRDLARQAVAKAEKNVKTVRRGVIGAIIQPKDYTPREGDTFTVPWHDANGVEVEVPITADYRIATVPATGTVVQAISVGSNVSKGAAIGKLFNEHQGGLYHFIKLGVLLEIFPPLIFLGIGALTDFGPLIANPKTLLLGGAAQLGVFGTFIAAVLLGFGPGEAASIGIIGGADGPTSIFLSNKLAPHLMAAIAVAAYSYMALVPMIQPPIMKALTTPAERVIRMKSLRKVGRTEKLVFALVVTVICILLVPPVAPLIGMLMLGNFIRESGVTDRLSKMAQNELINIVTIFLGTSVGITMTADRFLRADTLLILALGIVAFSLSTAGGVVMAKGMNLFLKEKINPLIGSAGVSAVPMAARVSQVEGNKYDKGNFLLMHAMGPNVAGVIGSAIAAGFFIAKLGGH